MSRILGLLLFPALWTQAEPLRLGVYVQFDARPADAAVATMQKEVSQILKLAGYVVDWRRLEENRGREAFANLVVVRFTGNCRLDSLADDEENLEDAAGTVTLGSTAVAAGRVLPFSEVRCDQVSRALSYAGGWDRRVALGTAMARVLAHELYHLLANTTRHAAHGLAKATQSCSDLVSGRVSFGEKDLKAIKGSGGALSFRSVASHRSPGR